MQFLLTKNIINDGDSIFIFDFSKVKKELEHVTAFEVQGEDITMYLDNYLSRKPNRQELALIEDILAKYKELKESTELDRAKALKLYELSTQALAFEQTENKEMYIISSLGYKVNADTKALRNINVLISQKVTQFKVYDNTLKPVTVDELKIIKSEIEQNALNLYQQKWTFEDLINKAETKEELDAIEIKFTMKDFSK